jgi:hypothetical protein
MARLAFVTLAPLGCLVLLGLGPRAVAGDLFHKSCAPDCNAQVIQLPAQDVVVETTRPRVVVQETKPLKRARAVAIEPTPFVATFFMPVVPAPAPAERATPEATRLGLAHQMEVNLLHLETARRANEAELAATQKVFDRMSTYMKSSASPAGDANVSSQIQDLCTRMERLERLVLLHSEALKLAVPKPPDMSKVPEGK